MCNGLIWYHNFGECILFFCGHLGLGFGCFVRLSCEMQQAVDDDAVQFVQECGTCLLGIGSHRIKGNINIAIYARARGIIKGNDNGIVVVLEKLAIDGQNLLVVAEDVVEFAYRVSVLSGYGFDPLFDFTEVDLWHVNIVVGEVNHRGVV